MDNNNNNNSEFAEPDTTGPKTAITSTEPRDHQSFDDNLLPNTVHVIPKFEKMNLPLPLLRGIFAYGFEKPSAIQQRAILPFIKGDDLIAQAQSGTGKTGAFTIGTLAKLESLATSPATSGSDQSRSPTSKPYTQTIILSPTRELALQTSEVCKALGLFMNNGKNICNTFIGGTRVQDDLMRAQSTIVAIGTPGRIEDLISRSALIVEKVKTVVIDEADEMFSQGFQQQILNIFKYLSKDVQVCLFSATMTEEVLEIASELMIKNPCRILVKKEMLTLDGIRQYYVAVEEDFKYDTLTDLYDSMNIAQCVIFCNTKVKVNELTEKLTNDSHAVSFIHSDMDKKQRENVIKEFRDAKSRVLVSTDLLARGIDVHHVSIVINYDLPRSKENYLHRIGRSGRFGRKGVAINFVTPADSSELKELEEHYHTVIEELPIDFASHLIDDK